MNGRGRFNYSRPQGFAGYGGTMGDPASSSGGEALERMTRQSAPRPDQDDPLWKDIEGTFQDILGEYANMDMDMPIKPPDMNDPQDQMRYLKDLESLGMSSAPSAALMGSNIRDATALLNAKGKAQKEQFDQIFKLLPMLEGNKGLQATMAAGLMNTLMPGQFDVQDQSLLGGFGPLDEEPSVTQLTPENVEEGQLFDSISAMTLPNIDQIMRGGDEDALQKYFDSLEAQLLKAKLNPAVVRAITEALHKAASDKITHEGIKF